MVKTKFQTVVEIPSYNRKTSYSKKNVFLGSCFTENVGNKMADLKYNVDINPFGILYNPASVANGINILLEELQIDEKELVHHNGLWHSFFHHGKFSDSDKNKTLENINSRLRFSSEYLKSTDFLFVTFGTAWIFEYKKTGEVVSNCHKIPAAEFGRRRLNPEEIENKYLQLLPKVWEQNPDCKIIFTVSPVRHWKDGAVENQRSKATLILAIDSIIRKFGTEKCNYFPSYEIMMDELRDYRFYADDMIHVSEVGIDHIWNLFEENLIDENSKFLKNRIQKIKKAFLHRPYNRVSKEYLDFLNTALKQVKELQKEFPNLNFELEKNHFKVEFDEIKKKFEQF
ncbi:GSCFA domain protein [Maribellus comscasis]|uniref:GSCFA domain protein n=1 Tax=Maribellus comscasis TaxID=2681766 RepID=A0A6I6JQV4_9BACT|nr:GSCFA domain-containing protein [Maribellus comscasis]QGY43569.1 GSCFA domain protein [Maribellus comscasis]